jgi:hypothetical protein
MNWSALTLIEPIVMAMGIAVVLCVALLIFSACQCISGLRGPAGGEAEPHG